MRNLQRIGLLSLALLVMSAGPALATVITFSGSGTGTGGAALSAQAIFDFSGDVLTVTLINTATADNNGSDQDVPSNTLTGVLFSLTGNPTLTPVSATIDAGSLVGAAFCSVGTCDDETTNVGGEFRYDTAGIASAGYIGGNANFNGPNLDDPDAVNGPNFGILSNDPSFHPVGGLLVPLIQNQVVLVLNGVEGLSTEDISNVSFQYGTSLTEPNLPGVEIHGTPEPTTLMLLGCGLAALRLNRRRSV